MSVQVKSARMPVEGPLRTIDDGSGFIVWSGDAPYLVTNWHVVTGRNRFTGEPLTSGAPIPDRLLLSRFGIDTVTRAWVRIDETLMLYADGEPIWLTHPVHGNRVDVVAIRFPLIATTNDGALHPVFYPVTEPDSPGAIAPTSMVTVIGYPYGHSSGDGFPIWATGSIASEPDADYDGLPCFLIDARTVPGQSGSPVITFWTGPKTYANGSMMWNGAESWELHGIYSGRIDSRMDIGRIWKRRAIREVIEGNTRDRFEYY
ncbi:S1 family peptidase [Microbacterium sp. 22303]|uniref:S1 family peptidase n=1 Tax=Microbacterium sp. 22303 TaxID=3453905 RepID=UPI003F84EE22